MPALTSFHVAAGPQSNMRYSPPISTAYADPQRCGVGVGVPAPRMWTRAMELLATRSLFLEAHVLVRRRKVEQRVQADRRLLDPRPDPVQGGGLEDRGVHDALVHQPLELIQHRLALLAVALLRLLPEQVVDIGIPAVGVGAGADDEGFQAR